MASTVLNSMPCPTEDIAASSLAGMIVGYEQGGHKVFVREIKTEETPAGWIAVVSIDIEDLEDEGEREEPQESEFKKAEDVIEDQNALFYTMHHIRTSEAERAFPEVEEEVNLVGLMEENEERMRLLEEGDRKVPQEDMIGVDSNSDALSDVFENDFQVAIEPETTPEIFMTEEELRRRKRTAEPVPEPQE